MRRQEFGRPAMNPGMPARFLHRAKSPSVAWRDDRDPGWRRETTAMSPRPASLELARVVTTRALLDTP